MASQGLHQGRAAGGGAGRPEQERRRLRQVPQPPDVPGHRRTRRRGRPSADACWTTSEPQIHEHPRDHHLQQAPCALRASTWPRRPSGPTSSSVEGNIDVVTLHQAGFDNAVASMGTALTTEQTRLLSPLHEGARALLRQRQRRTGIATQKAHGAAATTREFTVRVLELPNRIVDGQPVKQDVDDFIKNPGARRLRAAAQRQRESGWTSAWRGLPPSYDLTSDQQPHRLRRRRSADLLAELPNAVEREIYTGRAAERRQASHPDALQAGGAAQPPSAAS